MWFLATFSGWIRREGELAGDEVEHGGHIFWAAIAAGLALDGAVEALQIAGAEPAASPLGQDAFQMFLEVLATFASGASASPKRWPLPCTQPGQLVSR